MSAKTVRIGGASASWGDSIVAVPQLLASGPIDYLVFDYLAELTMSILAAARARNPAHGYALDFVGTIKVVLPELMARNVRVIANAGGLNPQACADALAAAAAELGLRPRIAAVTGDDVMPLIETLRAEGTVREMDSGEPLPAKLMTANAYLGALPIRRALDQGAQIVVTGRCVDSAVTLGALMHAFDWREDAYELLAAGSLAGHIIECGCQATGGLYTDWQSVPGWGEMGYPIVEAQADGRFIVTKPSGTGGLVSPPVIAEQILYEIGDPAAYVLPDVVCDFTRISLRQAGPDRVEVSGARGCAPTPHYKVCTTRIDGFKAAAQVMIIGFDAAEKGKRMADALLMRTRRLFRERGLADYTDTLVEVIGNDEVYGPQAQRSGAREVVLRIAAKHADKRALELFAGEIGAAGTTWAPGVTGISGRPKVQPSFRLYSFLIGKERVPVTLWLDGRVAPVHIPPGLPPAPVQAADDSPAATVLPGEPKVEVPLVRVAHGRSGDKGDYSNIGIVARTPELYPWLLAELTPERVKAHMAHLIKGEVRRFELPGLHALNFLCAQALAGGVASSPRYDTWGKGFAQILLALPVRVPAALLPPESRACPGVAMTSAFSPERIA